MTIEVVKIQGENVLVKVAGDLYYWLKIGQKVDVPEHLLTR